MRHTNGEIERAKMFRRRLLSIENVSAPPLSRVKLAAELFVLSALSLVRNNARRTIWKMLDRNLCPHCHGKGTTFTGAPCKLCEGKTYIGWKQRESLKWGRALFEYRMSTRMSLQMIHAMTGVLPSHVAQHESGLVALDDWPRTLYDLADLQLDREAAGHVSTT